MTSKGTPGRVIRVDKETWDTYGELCKAKGIARATDVRMYIAREVKAYEAEQRKIAAQERAASA